MLCRCPVKVSDSYFRQDNQNFQEWNKVWLVKISTINRDSDGQVHFYLFWKGKENTVKLVCSVSGDGSVRQVIEGKFHCLRFSVFS